MATAAAVKPPEGFIIESELSGGIPSPPAGFQVQSTQARQDMPPLPAGFELDEDRSGIMTTSLAAGTQAVLGMSRSIFETPETVARAISPFAKVLRDKPELAANPVLQAIPLIEDVGRILAPAGAAVSERIGKAQEILGEEFAPFREVGRVGQEANQAVKDMIDKGDFSGVRNVLASPKHWAAFIANAAPSLYAALKSGGSIPFIAWMEGMETATSAADFERRTGQKVSDEQFGAAVAQTAAINAVLEKVGLDRIRKAWRTSEGPQKALLGRVLNRAIETITAGTWEGGTEMLQQINTNVATMLNIDPEQSPWEDTLASLMGGAGSGGGAALIGSSGPRGKVTRETTVPTPPEGFEIEQPEQTVGPPQDQLSEQELTELGVSPEAARSAYPTQQQESRIPRANDLSPQERAVEGRFAAYIEQNTDEAIARYQEKFGKVINTDNARELSEDYTASREAQATLSTAVHEPASWLAKQIYERELAKPIDPAHPYVTFTAGGTGAGKSTAIETANPDALTAAQTVFDTNMNGLKSAETKIKQALDSGRQVEIIYIHRDPVDALVKGALPRAMNPERGGRTVRLSAHAATHIGAAKTIQKLHTQYKNDPRVSIQVIDNRGGKGEAKLADIGIIQQTDYTDLEGRLKKALDQEYQNGRINQTVYEGTKGISREVQARVAPARAEDRRQPEPQPAEPAGQAETAVNPAVFHANPIGVIKEGYQRMAQRAIDFVYEKVGYRFAPLRDMPAQKAFLTGYYQLLGRLSKVESIQRKLADTFTAASAEDRQAVYAYLTSREVSPDTIKNSSVRRRAIAAKNLILKVGDSLVRHKLLSPQAIQAHRGEYLPRVYLKYLLGEDVIRMLGRGIKPSDQAYTRMRKDIPADVRELILGEIKDPAYLAARAVGVPMRDMAILDFFEQISANKDWVWQGSIVDFNGAKVSVYWLAQEAQRLSNQAKYMQPEAKAQVEQIAKDMESKASLDQVGQVPEKFRQIPDTKRYGTLRGIYVRQEIYNQIVGNIERVPSDAGVAQKLLGYGGFVTKLTGLWKMSKVSLNPPTQIRNFVSNMVLLHLSGMPMHRIPQRLVQAIGEVRSNGKYWRIAKKHGVTESTFASREIYHIERDMLRIMQEHKPGALSSLLALGGTVAKFAGDTYGLMEALGKTAKIIDSMEREGKSESDAAMAAQEALFDYSLVPPSVRYLRNSAIPFLTFYYKAFPMMLKTLALSPWRFTPYVVIPYLMAMMIADDYDVEKEDLDKLRIALPQWLRERGHTMFLPWKDENGRWQVLDFGYFMPWAMFTELFSEAAGKIERRRIGEMGELLGTLGILGGPIYDIISAIKTGKDPFTRRDIANPADPPKEQLKGWMQYLWRLGAPSWMTDIGFVGHLYRSVTGHVNPRRGAQFGEPTSTISQAMARAVGVNIYPIDPELSVQDNLRQMNFELRDVVRRMRTRMRDPNLSAEQRENIRNDYEEEIQARRLQLEAYRDAANFHPNLISKESIDGTN